MQRYFSSREETILSSFDLYKSIFANRTKQIIVMLEINAKLVYLFLNVYPKLIGDG